MWCTLVPSMSQEHITLVRPWVSRHASETAISRHGQIIHNALREGGGTTNFLENYYRSYRSKIAHYTESGVSFTHLPYYCFKTSW